MSREMWNGLEYIWWHWGAMENRWSTNLRMWCLDVDETIQNDQTTSYGPDNSCTVHDVLSEMK